MNTVEAIMLSQLPIVFVGFLLWLEIRRITNLLTTGATNSNSINADKYLVRKPLKGQAATEE